MKKKKILALSMAAVLACGSSMTAFAAAPANVNSDGVEVTAPSTKGTGYNGSNEQKAGSSYGQATTQSINGTDWTVANDDDNVAEATTPANNYKTDINVWARVSDASAKIYKIDIAWGSMKFEYVDGSGTWDVTTHTYAGSGSGVPHWVNNGDGRSETSEEVGCGMNSNNQIIVTNHSNNAIDAEFAYTMLPTSGQSGATGTAVTPFNDGGTTTTGENMDSSDYKYNEGLDGTYNLHGDNDVIGYFYGDASAAAYGHTGVYNTYSGGSPTSSFEKNDSKASLDGNDTYTTINPVFLAGNTIALPTAESVGTGTVGTASDWGNGYIYEASSVDLTNWNTGNWKAGPRSAAVYFAFSGMPDEGQGAYLSAFKKVGTITVTITPDDTAAYNKSTT
jgi:hypothetical protein